MHARSSTFRTRPEVVDVGTAFVRDEVLPAVRAMPGCVGLAMLVDRGSGCCIVTTAWESEQLLRASAPVVAPLRDRAREVFESTPEVRTWQVGLLHRAHLVPAGAWARVTWTRLPRDRMVEHVDVFRAEVLPRIERLSGFCSASLLLDRHTGRSALTVVYDSREALEQAGGVGHALRAEALRRRPSELLAVAEVDVVLAHLLVPVSV